MTKGLIVKEEEKWDFKHEIKAVARRAAKIRITEAIAYLCIRRYRIACAARCLVSALRPQGQGYCASHAIF